MKWFKRVLLFLLVLPIVALAFLYIRSEMIIGREYASVPRTIALSTSPEVIAEGERLAQVMGCFHGCHGADMEGDVFFEEKWVGRFVAPNLTRAMDHYSLAELEAIIRQGILPDGTSVLGMPSGSFSMMSDEDLVAILSFIAGYPKHEHDAGESSVGLLARLGLVMGQYQPAAAEAVRQPLPNGFRSDPARLGDYLATTACSECHGMQLQGQEGFTPSLVIAKAYSIDDFRKLMSTGTGLGDRDLGLMSLVSRFRFSHMTDDEMAALYAFLQAR